MFNPISIFLTAIVLVSVMANELHDQLITAGLFDDLHLAISPNPIETLVVKFNGQELKTGSKFSKDQVANEPEIVLPQSIGDGLYTLLMVDPDAPSRDNPIRRSWLHWQITNIEGSSIKTGESKCDFNPSTPPAGSGFHRYVFLLLKQTKKIDNVETCTNRGSFDTAAFVANHDFGDIVAANFYEARNEPL